MEKPKVNPYIFVIIGVLSVSTSAIFVKFSTAPSGVIAFHRFVFHRANNVANISYKIR